ncbi:MAG: hypothetical protein HYY37_06940 [Candidatus Aenigmarchaeota archaeon]|nr:hypothetical protein [Candidatus Aenigmarchaeota archaeon]
MQCEICGKTENLRALPFMEVFGSTKSLFACGAHYKEVAEIAKRMSF